MKIKYPLLLVAAMLALVATRSDAASLISFNGGNAAAANTGNYTIGYQFTVTTAGLAITHLGVMDVAGTTAGTDGLTGQPVQVGLWNADGPTLIASASVSGTGTVGDPFVYASLSAIDPTYDLGGGVANLPMGTYLIGAYLNGKETWLDPYPSSIFTAGSGITLGENRYASGSFAAPTSNGSGAAGRWGPVNALVVPEPSAALLGGLGLLALARRRR